MTDQSAQEPTMEEILASIRRIISEDDAPAETAQAAAPESSEDIFPVDESPPEPEPEAEAEPVEEASPALMDETPSMEEPEASEDDVLELTDRYEAPVETASESMGDLDISEPSPTEPPAYAPEPAPVESAPVTQTSTDDLVGASAAGAAASAFAGLTASLRMPSESRSLEDLVKEMMRPMLKDWLDANLPSIVETQVRSEVERIARQGGR